eukprot:1375729-Rhodomonas_salina.4
MAARNWGAASAVSVCRTSRSTRVGREAATFAHEASLPAYASFLHSLSTWYPHTLCRYWTSPSGRVESGAGTKSNASRHAPLYRRRLSPPQYRTCVGEPTGRTSVPQYWTPPIAVPEMA